MSEPQPGPSNETPGIPAKAAKKPGRPVKGKTAAKILKPPQTRRKKRTAQQEESSRDSSPAEFRTPGRGQPETVRQQNAPAVNRDGTSRTRMSREEPSRASTSPGSRPNILTEALTRVLATLGSWNPPAQAPQGQPQSGTAPTLPPQQVATPLGRPREELQQQRLTTPIPQRLAGLTTSVPPTPALSAAQATPNITVGHQVPSSRGTAKKPG